MDSIEADAEVITDLRTKVLEIVREDDNIKDFYPEDIERFENDDHWIQRFYYQNQNDFDLTVDKIVANLKWRKNEAVLDIRDMEDTSTLTEILNSEFAFMPGEDVNGNTILWLRLCKFESGLFSTNDIKEFIIYYAEQAEKVKPYKGFTYIYDYTDAGLSNLDMEVIKMSVDLIFNYPKTYEKLICHNMGWLFNGAWFIMKGFLGEFANLVSFTKENALSEFVDEDNVPEYFTLEGPC